MLNRSQLPVLMLIDAFDKAVKILASDSAPLQERFPLAWQGIDAIEHDSDYCHLPSSIRTEIARIESAIGTPDQREDSVRLLSSSELELLAKRVVDIYADSLVHGRKWTKEIKPRIETRVPDQENV